MLYLVWLRSSDTMTMLWLWEAGCLFWVTGWGLRWVLQVDFDYCSQKKGNSACSLESCPGYTLHWDTLAKSEDSVAFSHRCVAKRALVVSWAHQSNPQLFPFFPLSPPDCWHSPIADGELGESCWLEHTCRWHLHTWSTCQSCISLQPDHTQPAQWMLKNHYSKWYAPWVPQATYTLDESNSFTWAGRHSQNLVSPTLSRERLYSFQYNK